MKYLDRLGKSPAQLRPDLNARLAEARGGEKPQEAKGVAPELRGGQGRPAPKHQGPGVGAVLARQTIGDVFTAAERVGVGPGVVGRHPGAFQQVAPRLSRLASALEKVEAKAGPEAASALRGYAGRLVSAASPGLAALGESGGAEVLGTLLAHVEALGEAPSPARAGAAVELLRVGAELKVGTFPADAEAVLASVASSKAEPSGLAAAVRAVAEARGTFEGLLGAGRIFTAAVAAALEVGAGADPAQAAQNLGAKAEANLEEGELKVVTGVATKAGAHLAASEKAADAAEKAAAAAEKKLEGKLAPIEGPLEGARALPPAAKQLFFAEAERQAGASDVMREAQASLHLAMLASAPDANAQALQGASQALQKLAQRPEVGEAGALALARLHAPATPAMDVAGTLTALGSLLDAIPQDARAKVAEAPSLADGRPALVVLADQIRGQVQRMKANDGPRTTVAAALGQAEGEAQLGHALRFALPAALATPDVENGPARDLLRKALPDDLGHLADAGLEHGPLVAAHPKLPEDSVARFAAIALDQGEDPQAWLAELTKLFALCRGNKNHVRNLRSLIAAIDEHGGDAVAFTRALGKAKLAGPVLTRLVEAMLNETANQPSADYVAEALKTLDAGGNLLAEINTRTSAAMMERLGLKALLEGGEISVTSKGMEAVEGPLQSLFKNGVNRNEVNQEVLKGALVAVLEDDFDAFRFTTEVADSQLQSLSHAQRRLWEQPRAMTHIRLDDASKALFYGRVDHAAKIAGALAERMTEAWGARADLEKTLSDTTAKLRDLPKDDTKARKALISKIDGLPKKLEALRWAERVAAFSPDTVTPELFLEEAKSLDSLFRALGPPGQDAVRELMWTMRLGDINYTEVVSNDGPDLDAIFKVSTTNCLNWPGYGGEVLAYGVDPNKRMVMTENANGEPRRAVLRIVERQDEGHEGEPMLLLERTYPDKVSTEEKQRLVEHALRRAHEMGIACAFATEYYWDASKTQRRAIIDMNEVIQDLSARYGYAHEKKIATVKTRGGNMNVEYLDSAPQGGANARGRAGYRGHPSRYDGGNWQQNFRTDKDFENELVIMSPQG